MAAPTTDWQATIRELFTIGRDTDYPGLGGAEGAGLSPFLSSAAARGLGFGVTFGVDRLGPRTLRIPVEILGDTEADTWGNYRALASAWRPAPDGTEVPLDVRWPGMVETTMRLYGHPGEVAMRQVTTKSTHLAVECQFTADPWWYGAEVTQASATSPITIAASAAGESGADTDRVTLVIYGNGGTPQIIHSPSNGDITFTSAVTAGDPVTIDLHTRAVTKSAGAVDTSNLIAASSSWFRLTGGVENELTLNNVAAVTIVHRPAHWSP